MSETNYEHYKDEIMKIGLLTPAEMCRFKKKNIHKTDNCVVLGCDKCDVVVKKWLDEPYEEPVIEIDWEKVPVDTPVYVSDDCEFPDENNFHRYFKCFNGEEETRFECFQFGATSWSCGKTYAAANEGWNWRYCSLARPEDIEKYKKV